LPEIKPIVRLAGKDLNGLKKVAAALKDIKGIGLPLAYAILHQLKIDPNLRLGQLSDSQLAMLEKAVKSPSSIGLPSWLLNRRKDIETGKDLHLIEADWEFTVKMDIEREKRVKSWRGIRHALGLKVRGQRTRTTGRKGRTVGVRKSAK
jgi:small subunit ribosomal protein S13